ncbi:hypothetical protein JOM56_010443 [Amanita muscaria]
MSIYSPILSSLSASTISLLGMLTSSRPIAQAFMDIAEKAWNGKFIGPAASTPLFICAFAPMALSSDQYWGKVIHM